MPNSSENPIKVVLVTDVPFWHCKTGAQLRITQLLDALTGDEFNARVLVTDAHVASDIHSLDQFPNNLETLDLTQSPKNGILPRLRWQAAAIANRLGFPPKPGPREFDRYYSKLQADRFVEFVNQHQPKVLLFEYATQIQLLRSLPRSLRKQSLCIVDTHDILWKRAKQFEENDQPHWIRVRQEQEENALREFDLIMAIQTEEADYFQKLVGREKVVTTSLEFHPMAVNSSDQDESSKGFSIGYFGSANWANEDTLAQILKCWDTIVRHSPHLELILAGGICESKMVKMYADHPSVSILGPLKDPNEFYRGVDIVWNPVRFGTGLKIKNLEALAHAKCLVTSRHGAIGLGYTNKTNESGQRPMIVLDQAGDFELILDEISLEQIEKIGKDGQKHLVTKFGPNTQYPQLRRKIREMVESKRSN